MSELPAWLEKLRADEERTDPEVLKRIHVKRCPHCGEADGVFVNGLGVYVCGMPGCVHEVSPLHGVMLWWKFDTARDGGKEKDHKSRLPHKAGWVHGSRIATRLSPTDLWMPRHDATAEKIGPANAWTPPVRRKKRRH